MTRTTVSSWSGPDLDRASERVAANETLNILNSIKAAMLKSIETGETLHWICDVGTFGSATRQFMFNTLGEGEVRIELHRGEAKVAETSIPGLWRLMLGSQESLVAALLPRCVEVAAAIGSDQLVEPEVKPQGLFAAPAILTELRNAMQTVPNSDNEHPAYQVDLLHQPLNAQDKNYLLTTLGDGKVHIELVGFANSRIRSTKVKGIWRSQILNNAGKPLLDNIVIAKIPPEVPLSQKELPDSVKEIDDLIEWIERDLARGVLG